MILNIEKEKELLGKKVQLNEVYIGKTPELMAIEKELDKFRNKYMSNISIIGNIKRANANQDPDLLKINRMLEDYFGFGCLSITIWHSMEPNAFTLSISDRLDIAYSAKYFFSTKNGYKFNKDADYAAIIVVYDSIMFSTDFTTAEVMAIIMHEIGHNFNLVMSNAQGIYNRLHATLAYALNLMTLNIPGLVLTNNTMVSIGNKLEQKIQAENKLTASVLNYSIFAFQFLKSLRSVPYKILNVLTLGLFNILIDVIYLIFSIAFNPVNTIIDLTLQPFSYADEKEADNFATMYGYGPETVSVQAKLGESKFDRDFKNMPLFGHIYATNLFITDLIVDPLSCHPKNGDRMRDQLDLLKYEVKKEDLDPKIKKVLIEDIKLCEKELDKLSDVSKGIKDPDFIKHLYWRVIYKSTNNRSLKDLFIGLIIGNPDKRFDEYDKAYRINKEK